MGGPIAINQIAIHAAMDLYQVEHREDCFDKVVNAARVLMQEDAEKQKQKAGKS